MSKIKFFVFQVAKKVIRIFNAKPCKNTPEPADA